jgi:Antibiotic biosynthesis monooxygenase
MPILHIEHRVSDVDTWLETFRKFAPAREQAGVQSAHVWQPCDDPHYIVINLEFESVAAAANFRTFLRENVWSSKHTSPALAGEPKALILNEIVVD